MQLILGIVVANPLMISHNAVPSGLLIKSHLDSWLSQLDEFGTLFMAAASLPA
jgi:hypothetical protein